MSLPSTSRPPTLRRALLLPSLVVPTFSLGACRGEVPTAPSPAAHEARRVSPPSPVRQPVADISAFVGRFLPTPLRAQPRVTPSLRIASPSSTGRVVANRPVTVRVRYAHFDNRPERRTPDAGATLGSAPQTLTDGYVQGDIQGSLQALPGAGRMPDVNATSFCVLERVVERHGYSGVAEGECPAVPPGEYRLSVEFQTNSHTAILKDGPRATPTSDVVLVRVR